MPEQITEVQPVREVEERPVEKLETEVRPCPRDVGHGTDSWYERPARFRRYRVDRDDLQGNVLQAYGNDFDQARYVFVEIPRGHQAAGRRFLRELADQVTTAAMWPEGFKPLKTLNVAITWRGLEALGLPRPLLCSFPEDFRQGMKRRAEALGDTDANGPDNWDEHLKEPQLLVTLTARDEQVLRFAEAALGRRIEELGLQVAQTVNAKLIEQPGMHELVDPALRGREHFGFADGFSQPAVRHFAPRKARRGMGTSSRFGTWRMVAPGEFVLGYPGEDRLLPPAPPDPLGRNGSYMVVRKLEQDVPGFVAYLHKAAESLPGLPRRGDPDYQRQVKARARVIAGKMVGRWPDGRSLVASGDPIGPGAGESGMNATRINDFRYGPDPDGFHCPLGAHVRRANPRDGFGFRGQLTRRHRILRRSMPYGEPLYDSVAPPRAEKGMLNYGRAPGEEYERPKRPEDETGLMFVCFQASIARQFEVIQGQWLNGGNAFWLGEDKDLLTMGMPGAGGKMTIQGDPPRFIRTPEKSVAPGGFVTNRGGGYFFAPGLTALRALGAGYWR